MLHPFAAVRECAPIIAFTSPGQLPTHYAPKTRLIMVERLEDFSAAPVKRVGALCFCPVAGFAVPGSRSATAAPVADFAAIRYLSERGDLREAAANLFRILRELDAENLDVIVAERVPEEGIGGAINDRLKRASNNPSSRA
jgi:L-threonylcarbamoyladenylate synthase